MVNKFMKEAINEAYKGIKSKHGGPFGAVVVKNNKIIGKGHNMVLKNSDPTAHGEVSAIRNACKNVKAFNLQGATIYTTAEPCPMCLGAILWANIKNIYYGCSVNDTKHIGFKDEEFYKKFKVTKSKFNIKQIDKEECLKLFKDYKNSEKTLY